MRYNKTRIPYREEIKPALKAISICASLVRKCDSLLLDHRGRRHTKTGKDAATTWEIETVIKLRTGQVVRNLKRTDYTTTVQSDHSVIVREKSSGQQWSATALELDNEEAKQFGDNTQTVPGSMPYSNPKLYANTQQNSKVVTVVAEIAKAVGLIGGIVATIASAKKAIDSMGNSKEKANLEKEVISLQKELLKTQRRLHKAKQEANSAKNDLDKA